MAKNGTLWLDYPSQGGPSPDLPIEVEPVGVEYFRHHSSLVHVVPGSLGISWVSASGVQGITGLTITLSKEAAATPHPYTIRLHFAEMDAVHPGDRVFGIRLQDRLLVPAVDIAREVGWRTALVKEFRGVPVADKLRVRLDQNPSSKRSPVLCGIELTLEGP